MKKLVKIFLGGVATLIVIGLIAAAGESETKEANVETKTEKAVTKEEIVIKKPGKAEFDQIKSGMTLEEVERILGPGELMSESEASGIKIQFYSWKASGDLGANITADFTDGKMGSKAQFGVK